jgi:TRAP-type transport system periplasmic protein
MVGRVKFPSRSLLAFLLLALAGISCHAAPEKVRLATLAPKGTSFHQILLEMGALWAKAPGGGAQLTVFADGTMGSEADMVRRMRLGQLQASLITVTGLSQIEPSTSVMQNMPFMFRTLKESEVVRQRIAPELEKRLAAKGFIVLGWTDGGWVQFFSSKPVSTPDEVKRLRIFSWAGDKETQSVARDLGFQPVPLETADILVSLNTGMIDVVPAPPFFALAGQLFGPAPHMIEVNYAPIVGAIVVTKRLWDKLPAETKAALRTTGADAATRITEKARIEMGEAIAAMRQRGMTVTKPEGDVAAAWEALARDVRPKLRTVSSDPLLYDEAVSALDSFRTLPSP